jgi:imidazole glycerol-phosphate synthase subunit HisF
MGLAKRIIPALDIKSGQVVKGISFDQIRAVGNPVALAKRYQEMGADELVFLDITATIEGRATMKSVVDQVSKEIFIPLTVGGGIRSLDEMTNLIQAGADKIFLNSAAVKDPGLVTAGAQVFGAQAMVGAIDAKWDPVNGFYRVYSAGGAKPTELDAIKWAQELVQAGAGELLVTSIDADGQKKGYDLRLYRQLTAAVDVPIIASGGAGTTKDFVDVFEDGSVDAALAASVFHYNQIAIPDLKRNLREEQVEVRL